jgi:hypothetical protein
MTSCLRYSSGAMRMNSVMSRSLWCVTNGLAVAPPAIMFIIGVSTSRKLRVSRYRRMYRTMLARTWHSSPHPRVHSELSGGVRLTQRATRELHHCWAMGSLG